LRGDAENGFQRVQRPLCQAGFVLFFFGWGGKIALAEKGFESKRLFDFASVESAAESFCRALFLKKALAAALHIEQRYR
jgi:hypothetical protein